MTTGDRRRVVLYADPLIRHKGDQGVLLIVTDGAGELHKVDRAFSSTVWIERGVKTALFAKGRQPENGKAKQLIKIQKSYSSFPGLELHCLYN